MGARRLRDWLSQPLAAAAPIARRREAVQPLGGERAPRWMTSAANWPEVRDLERTLGRLSSGSGNGRDLLALRQALEKIPGLKDILARLPQAARAPAELRGHPRGTPRRRPA